MKKIKILECIRQGMIGGGESHLLSLVENLDRDYFEPFVLSFTDGPMIERLEKMRVPTQIIPISKPFDVFNWGRIKKFFEKNSFDLVHAHGSRACSNILWPAKRLGLPVVYTIHGWSFHEGQNAAVKKIRIISEQYLTSRTDINISVSQSNQKTGLDNIRNFSSVVIANGIDHVRFAPTRIDSNVRQDFGIGQNELVVLFIARFTLQKQPLTLIKAFAEALKSNQLLRLVMVGEGEEKDSAIRLAESLGISNKITFQPFRQDVPNVLAAADIFVLPSLWEGLPIGLIEAMAMGKAVIATEVDGTKEVLRSGENGIMVTPANIEMLASSILQLAGNAGLRKELGQKAIETVATRFSAAEMTRKVESIYRKLTN